MNWEEQVRLLTGDKLRKGDLMFLMSQKCIGGSNAYPYETRLMENFVSFKINNNEQQYKVSSSLA